MERRMRENWLRDFTKVDTTVIVAVGACVVICMIFVMFRLPIFAIAIAGLGQILIFISILFILRTNQRIIVSQKEERETGLINKDLFVVPKEKNSGNVDVTKKHDIPTVYERMRHAKSLGFQPKVILDGGANQGKWTKWTSTIFKDAHYICVEPNHTLNDTIAETIGINTRNYKIVNVALSKEKGKGQLNVWDDSSGASLLEHVDGAPKMTIETEIITIDELCRRENLACFDLIKLDLQGGELDALLGAREALKSCEMVITEFGCLDAYKNRTTNKDLFDFFEDMGFDLYDVVDIHYRPYDGALTGGDFFFVKKTSPLKAYKGYK